MTLDDAIVEALRDAGCPTNDRAVTEVRSRLPVDVTVADVVAADVRYGCTIPDLVGAIRGECRMRAEGHPSGQRVRSNPTLPDPLPPPPTPEVGLRGLAAVRAALAAHAPAASSLRIDAPPEVASSDPAQEDPT